MEEENNNNNEKIENTNNEATNTNPVNNNGNNKEPISEEDNKKANRLCLISLLLQYVPFLLMLSLGIHSVFYSTFIKVSLLASFILMIVVRVKYPKNTFGLVLMILYIINTILIITTIILVVMACYQAISCLSGIDFITPITDCIQALKAIR